MSLKSNLQEIVESAKKLMFDLPISQERRKLEISLEQVESALSKVSDEATMKEVKDQVKAESNKQLPKEEVDALYAENDTLPQMDNKAEKALDEEE